VPARDEELGHVAGWQGSSTGRDRAAGFRAGLGAAGREAVAVIDGLYDRATAARAARDLMAAPEPPDAIFVGNDHMAFAVMDELRFALGLRVPQDVSVVGYDDVPMAAWPAYDLTTLRQPVNRMVTATVETLIGLIEGDAAPQRVRVPGPLMVRGSSRRPPERPPA
jgi:DNA-binding LacI/PurR family transcriptional regulator